MKWREQIVDKSVECWVKLRLFMEDTRGASGIEYAVIAAMVAVVIIGISATFSSSISTIFTKISDALKAAVT